MFLDLDLEIQTSFFVFLVISAEAPNSLICDTNFQGAAAAYGIHDPKYEWVDVELEDTGIQEGPGVSQDGLIGSSD
ncbi:MAG: hypothetical protein KOO60_07625 [Gemmatimonadales bacterium]|nr:hypothetical protein [Gemmatimonadales bacterium]